MSLSLAFGVVRPIIVRVSDVPVEHLLSVAEAEAVIAALQVVPRVETVDLTDAAGRVSAEDIVAPRDLPAGDKSQMDGFAVRSSDTPGVLRVVGEITAGATFSPTLKAGEAVAIMTGGLLPCGADAIVPIERAELTGEKNMRDDTQDATRDIAKHDTNSRHADDVSAAPWRDATRVRVPATPPGKSVAPRGSDVRAGTIVLRAGITLGARQLAVAATVGAANLRVLARPRVAVLTTGDEVIAHSRSPGVSSAFFLEKSTFSVAADIPTFPGMLECPSSPETSSAGSSSAMDSHLFDARVYDANGPLLRALLESFGCDVVDLGHAADDRAALRRAVEQSAGCDVLFVTGGMSAGRYDFVPPLLVELGYALRVRQLKIRPGKPFVFGELKANEEGRMMNDESAKSTAAADSPFRIRHSSFDSLPRFVFGLPGNPVSGFVGVVRLASGLLARLGAGGATGRVTTRPLTRGLPANGPREAYLPGKTHPDGGVSLLHSNGSADVFILAAADVLIVRPADDGPRQAGEITQCWELL